MNKPLIEVSANNRRYVLLAFGGCLVLAGITLLIRFGIPCWREYSDCASWRQFPAIVSKSQVRETWTFSPTEPVKFAEHRFQIVYTPEVHYTYSVDGTTHSGTNLYPTSIRFFSKRAAQSALSRYAPEMKTTAFVSPTDPGKSVLLPVFGGHGYAMIVFPCLVVLAGALLVGFALFLSAQNRKRSGSGALSGRARFWIDLCVSFFMFGIASCLAGHLLVAGELVFGGRAINAPLGLGTGWLVATIVTMVVLSLLRKHRKHR